jgi:hypothetical protein
MVYLITRPMGYKEHVLAITVKPVHGPEWLISRNSLVIPHRQVGSRIRWTFNDRSHSLHYR